MGKSDDSPSLILRVSPRGIIPASSLDAEVLDGYRPGTELEARILHTPPNMALRKWWALMSLLCKVHDRWEDKRAASNSLLIEMGVVNSVALLGGGVHMEPMSLRDFSEGQLEKLYNKAVTIIEQEILPPGHNLEEMARDYKRNRIGRSPS